MTVKLGKLFSSNSSTNSTTHNKMSSPPPLPPPNPSLSCNYYNANTNQHHHQLQQKSQRAFNPYVDEMEDDDISLYSTTASIITARDHPYNNSQRPLLADRKPQLLLGSNANNNKKKTKNQTAANQQSSPKLSQNHHQQQQQQQPQQQQLQQQQQQQEQKQKPEQKSYISPYVQQQKRDSVKGLHGFNDFDILSQQYNKHLQSPHIGYPYGSPPSPNSNSTAVDFVFDSADSTTTPIYRNNYASISTPLTVTTCYGNAVCDYGSTLATSAMTEVNAIDYYRSNTNVDAINKLSRFEDDFCNRRNINFAKIDQKLTTSDDTNLYEGPFIFGIPPEQQTDFTRLGINGRSFDDITSCKAVITNNGKQKLDKSMKQTVTQTSNSDTSSTTRDDSSTSNDSNGDPKGATKFLLRKRKTKKITKEGKPFNVVIEKPTIKCVLVGDCAVGKTNLILSYLENRFNTEHIPTASDIYNADVMVNDSPVHLTLCDTAGQDTLDPLRELCYPDSDVFLLCFSIAKPKTFHAIKNKWAPKFAKTKASLILVGTQADLRNNPNVLNKLQSNGEKPISHADAWDLATTIGAKYIETSSATQDKVKEVFDTAIWEGLAPTNLPPTPPPLWKKLFCLV